MRKQYDYVRARITMLYATVPQEQKCFINFLMGAQVERKRICHLPLNVLKSDFLEPLTLCLICYCQRVIIFAASSYLYKACYQ